jgi:hypothetical protein
VIKAAAPCGGAAASTPGACALPLSGAEGLQGRGVAQFRDGCHALGGEHAPALQLPVLVLLQQHRPHQAGDGGVVGEDADDAGAALDFFIDPLQQVGAPYLSPMVLGEVAECQHVVACGLHDRHSGGELLAQHLGAPLPVGAHLVGCLDHKHRFHGRRHHVLASLRDVGQEVAQEVHPAPLPGAALEHPLDRRRQSRVGVRDHQLDANKAPLSEGGDELRPEGLSLTIAHLETNKLPAIGIDPHRHHRSARGDLLSLALPPIEVGGIQVDIGIASLLQRPVQESLDLLINLLTDAGSPEIPGEKTPGISGVPLRLT